MASSHLDEVIERHNKIVTALVVNADIEKYSRRRTLAQIDAVEAFTANIQKALDDISQECVSYAQKNDINFDVDILKLPTGDGLIIGFTFDGLPDIHLRFARSLIEHVGEFNAQHPCDRFDQDGWCNCHANHNVRIGLTEGKSVIYRDVNGSYNIAGSAVNLATRVMQQADRNQILLSEHAYSQLIDLVEDPSLSDRFRIFDNIAVKHGLKVNLSQYVNEDDQYLNNDQPSELALLQEMNDAGEAIGGFPFNMIGSGDRLAEGRAIVDAMKMMGNIQKVFEEAGTTPPIETRLLDAEEDGSNSPK